jgi:hypothetical protein
MTNCMFFGDPIIPRMAIRHSSRIESDDSLNVSISVISDDEDEHLSIEDINIELKNLLEKIRGLFDEKSTF